MSKKVKFKVKKGKVKVKLKAGEDGALALSEANLRGLLVLAMASALEPGAGREPSGMLAAGGTVSMPPPLLLAGGRSSDEPSNDVARAALEEKPTT